MKKILVAFAALVMLAGCAKKAEGPAKHPDWTYNSVMYEVNIRQFSPEGTFKAVEEQLPRLAELGVDILWLMPMYEIGVEGRKGTLGSYYAISDYCKVNPEFGTMQDFEDLLSSAHAAGFKVILDWVANQTAPDNVWMREKPADFYERDADGNAIWEYDWTDTRSLNYENTAVWDAQEECMRFWLDKGVDGFRCDAAGEMPSKVWEKIIPELQAAYPDAYFLAEAEKPELAAVFDATYSWELHHLMNDIAQGKKTSKDLIAYIAKDEAKNGANAFRLMFTSNHDENSWAGTEFERMGDAASVMAVLCFTLPKGQPLIYTGQEIGLSRRLEFFEKDPITDWSSNDFTSFFKGLVDFRHAHKALSAGDKGGPIEYLKGYPEGIFAFRRAVEGDAVTVIANLTSKEASLPDGSSLCPWGYKLLAE